MVLLVTAATLIQYLVVALAMRVVRITRYSPAWIMIAAVALLMAARRTIVLHRLISGHGLYVPDPVGELDALAASFLMAIGVALIGRYFLAIQRSEAALRRRSAELSKRVAELDCLYGLSTLIEKTGDDIAPLLPGVVALVASSMQHPQLATARITVAEHEYHTPGFAASDTCIAANIIAAGQPLGRIEVCYRPDPPRGPVTFFEEERSLLRAVAERLGRTVERLRAEEKRADLQEHLHQVHKMEAVGQLAAGLAHDFSNLLTVIRVQADAVSEQLHAGPAADALALVRQAAANGTELTRSLLTFSRRLPTDRVPLGLRTVVDESVRLLRGALPSSIELDIQTAGDDPLCVNADCTQLQQVILTMAFNARDAMPTGGRLTIILRAAPQTRRAILTITDTGAGMSPEVAARIFEPFFTTKPRGKGTGLGLAMAHSIIAEHDGRIAVQSAPGRGTTFTIELPCLAAADAGTSDSMPISAPRGTGELVLLREGDAHVRGVIALGLEAYGYQVLQTADTAAALDLARRHVDQLRVLVVGDDPRSQDGSECLRALRAVHITTPAVLLTSDATAEPDAADDHTLLLPKPFDLGVLRRAVSAALCTTHVEIGAE